MTFIIFGELFQVMKLLIMQSSPVSCLFALLGHYILHSILFSNTPICSSLSVRDQVSHPYKTKGKARHIGRQIYKSVPLLFNLHNRSFVYGSDISNKQLLTCFNTIHHQYSINFNKYPVCYIH
jgi:hypothetical protein